MLAIATLAYIVPLDQVVAHTDAHRAYLASLHARGKLLASGPFVPRTGGALLLNVADDAELKALIAADPFHALKIAEYQARIWSPTIGADVFAALAAAAPAPTPAPK